MKKKEGGKNSFKVFQDLKELLGIDNPETNEIDDMEGLEGLDETGIIEVNSNGKEVETSTPKENTPLNLGGYGKSSSSLEAELNAGGNYQTIFVDPKTFADCKKIATCIKSDKMVTLNLEYLDLPTAQRLMDFLAGAMSIKGASFIEISKKVYTAVPKSMKVYYEGKKDSKGRTILDFGREEK